MGEACVKLAQSFNAMKHALPSTLAHSASKVGIAQGRWSSAMARGRGQYPRLLVKKHYSSWCHAKTIRDPNTGELYWFVIGEFRTDDDGSTPTRDKWHGPFKTVAEVFQDQIGYGQSRTPPRQMIDVNFCKPSQ